MKANKVVVTITVECLHIDAVRGIVSEAAEIIHSGSTPHGNLVKDDGDTVTWKTDITPVEF